MPRAVILTALDVEFQAVRTHLRDEMPEVDPRGTQYVRGRFDADGVAWDVLLVQTGMGNPRAAVEAERAISRFSPNVALFVGVAGGLKDVELGDVVAGPKIYGYEFGKSAEDFLPRGDVGQSSYPMEQCAIAVSRDRNWQSRIVAELDGPVPNSLVKPIAAGSKVVAATTSAEFELLKTTYSDAVAVEMEGLGFLQAARANPGVDALVVRGISDLIDQKTESDAAGWQEAASRHAAAFAFEVLARYRPTTESPPFPKDDAVRIGETPSFPGIRPHVWRVPHPRNPIFSGREDILAQLATAFADSNEIGIGQSVQAIHGLGGVGKSQIAVEYAHRHAAEYEVVWWVRAEDPATLAADYAALARELRLPEAAIQEQAATIEAAIKAETATTQAVLRWLERGDQRWLLVFDNAEHPSSLDPYLPTSGTGHVLITSRNPNWTPRARTIAVLVLPSADAIEFLQSSTGDQDNSTAATLAEELGYLPLALAQAAAYVNARSLTLKGYLDRFRTQRREVLKRGGLTDYEATIATTWELAFQGTAEQVPAAADLLNIISLLAPDAIPLEVLIASAPHLPEPLRTTMQDPVALDDAVVALRRYSLVEVIDDQTVSVHRLVQAVVQDRLNQDHLRAWAEAAIHVVAAALPDEGGDPRTWPSWERILPHALAAIQVANNLGLTGQSVAKLNARVGVHLAARGRPNEARPMLEQALELMESEIGTSHVDLANGLHHLARILRDMAELPAALQAIERALAIDDAAYGNEHPDVAADLSLLGNILRDQGLYDAAQERLEQALAIRTRVLGSGHREVAVALNDLGVLFRRRGDFASARSALEQALQIHERVDGDESIEVAITLGNLGDILNYQGNHERARAYLQRSLDINEKLYGAEHPIVATALLKLARALMALGSIEVARAHLERALAIDERAYGTNHPAVTPTLDTLANLLQVHGDVSEAKELHERALLIRETKFGPGHPQVATSLNNIADILQAEGDLAGARARFERAIQITKDSVGEDTPSFATYNRNLANVLAQQGDLVGARQAMQKALPIWRRVGNQERIDETLHRIRMLTERIRASPRSRPQ